MRKIFSITLLVSFFSLKSQDAAFVNPNGNLFMLNPSFAGSNGGIRDQFSYRVEGPSTSWRNELFANSLDAYIKKLHAGIGVSLIANEIDHGTFKNTGLNFIYAQHLKLKESGWLMVPSIQVSYFRKQVDVSALNFNSPIMSSGILPQPVKSGYDASAGLLMKFKTDFYGGIYFFHVNQPDVGLVGSEKLPMRFTIHTAYSLHFGEKTLVQLLGIYNLQDKYDVFHFNATLVANHLIAGLGMRLEQGPNFILGYRGNFFTASAGYDFNLSKLSGNPNDAYELHLSYNLRNKELRRSVTNIEAW